MKCSALVIIITFLFTFVAKANASTGGSTVKVQINNKVNTGGTSSFKSSTKSSVNIHQEGEGTSEVKINGQEWKVEGPGDLSVESSGSTPVPTQVADPTNAPTSPSDAASPTTTEDANTAQEPEEQKDEKSSVTLGEMLKESFEAFKNSLENFFSKIFKL